MERYRLLFVASSLVLTAGFVLLLIGQSSASTQCTSFHGTLGECHVQHPTWAIYSGGFLVVASIALASWGAIWRHFRRLPMP